MCLIRLNLCVPPPLRGSHGNATIHRVNAKAFLSSIGGGERETVTFEFVSGNGPLVKGDG